MLEAVSGNKLLRLPAEGRLLVCADLRGNLRDFLRVVDHFERLPVGRGQRYLLFLGDLLHGPLAPAKEWPESLGRPYKDGSPGILLHLSLLQERYPGQVHALIGNHEHGHLGGPHTARFAKDEVIALERRLGGETSAWFRQWLSRWPLLALAPCGVLFSHRPPPPSLRSLDELAGIDYQRYEPPVFAKDQASWDESAQLLGQILWSRPLSPKQAFRVLSSIGMQVAVFGHEQVFGHEAIGAEQLVLASSFLLPDRSKRYLLLDLSSHYRSTADFRLGEEIRPLYA